MCNNSSALSLPLFRRTGSPRSREERKERNALSHMRERRERERKREEIYRKREERKKQVKKRDSPIARYPNSWLRGPSCDFSPGCRGEVVFPPFPPIRVFLFALFTHTKLADGSLLKKLYHARTQDTQTLTLLLFVSVCVYFLQRKKKTIL